MFYCLRNTIDERETPCLYSILEIIGEKYCCNIILLKCVEIGKEMGREMDVKICTQYKMYR